MKSRGLPLAAALAVVLGTALVLRLWNIDAGLPFHLLNPDEDTVLGRAMSIGVSGDPNPHWFLYPTFFMYVVDGLWGVAGLFWHSTGFGGTFNQAAFTADSTPYFTSARVMVAVLGAATALAAYGIGRELAGAWAGLFAAAVVAVETTGVAYGHMAVTDVPMTLLFTLSLWLLLRAANGAGPRWLVGAAVLAGVATSTKYNAGILLLPLAAATAMLFGRRWRPYLAGLGLFAVGFVIASPFALLDLPTFASDFIEQNRINAGGWLGFENIDNGWWYNLAHTWGHSLGLPVLLLAAVGLVLAAARRNRVDLLLLVTALPYFIWIGTWDANFDRYLLPLVPIVGAFGGLAIVSGAKAIGTAVGKPWARTAGVLAAVAIACAALSVPLTRAADYDRGLALPNTRALALPLLEQRIPQGSVVATDTLAVPLADAPAAEAFRHRGIERPAYRLVRLPTPNPGRRVTPRQTLAKLEMTGVQYVVASSAVRDRVLAAASRYPIEAAFYRQLDAVGPLLRVTPRAGQQGPAITLYRIQGRHGLRG